MCYMLYLGANQEFPPAERSEWESNDSKASDWPLRAPRLVVKSLSIGNDSVRRHFTEAFVVNIGSYEGCGCGFNQYSEAVAYSEQLSNSSHDVVSKESRMALAEYVASNSVRTLFGCWADDESLAIDREVEVSLLNIADAAYRLPEKVLMRVKP